METSKWLPWKQYSSSTGTKVASWWCRYHEQSVRLWKPIELKWATARKVPVLECHQIPESNREPGIIHGYRPDHCSWSECWGSLFSANNETFNVWSHLIAAVYFVWRTVRLAKQWSYINQSDGEEFKEDGGEYCRVFMVYMFTACLYPTMSATAHAFCAKSRRVRAICFFVDYGAIAYYSFGCALLYRAYVLPESWMTPGWTNLFLGFSACLSLTSTLLTCSSRALVTDILRQRIMRLAAFTLPYIWDTIPLVHRLSGCWFGLGWSDEHASCLTEEAYYSAQFHSLQIFFAFLASFTYASHLPERVCPGKFDYVGHSHNLMHICGALATAFQLEGSLVDLMARRDRLTSANLALVDAWWTLTVPLVVLIGHAVLLIAFSRYIFTHPESDNEAKTKCH